MVARGFAVSASGIESRPPCAGNGGLTLAAAVSWLVTLLGSLKILGAGGIVLTHLINSVRWTAADTVSALLAIFVDPGVRTRGRLQRQFGHHAEQPAGRS